MNNDIYAHPESSPQNTVIQNLSLDQLKKAKSNYTAIQILMIISTVISAVGVLMLIYSLLTSGGYEFFALICIIFNLPYAILFWKRPKAAYYFGFLYCIPMLPAVLGIIVMFMWSKTKIFFGADKVSIADVDNLLNR